MHNFVPLLAFVLGCAYSGALLVPDKGSPSILSNYETDFGASLLINGNRGLQALGEVYDNDEVRVLPEVVAEASAPVVGSLRAASREKALQDFLTAEMVLKSYAQRSNLTPLQKWTPTQEHISEYKELQDLPQSPGLEEFNPLIARGRTPFFWKAMIDARNAGDVLGLPLYTAEDKAMELDRLKLFTCLYIDLLYDYGDNPTSLLDFLYNSMGSNIPAQFQDTGNLVINTKKVIKTIDSVDELIEMDVSPVIYAKALTEASIEKLPSTDLDRHPNGAIVSSLGKRETDDVSTILVEPDAPKDKLVKFGRYCSVYEQKLYTLLDEFSLTS